MNSREINLIKELFKGREDVFAIHWQKGTKSGYMPACHYDPYMYRLHKINGGTFNSYKGKTYLPFTDQQIARHLNGEQLIGIYPLLKDHTSWFIVADFDQHNWTEESQAFVGGCFNKGIPAYLERSRSGNGGHVWVFFNQPYPAIRSRKIILSILEETGIFSAFDKSLSFDRLFPNQDVLSGKGFGNLIALPLHKTAREHGNSCFVDEHFTPYKNQWGFLSSVQKVTTVHLDEVFESLTTKQRSSATTTRIISDQLYITLNRSVQLNRSGMTPEIIHFLKEELHFANPEYFIKKKTGKSTHNTKRYFKFIEETENQVILPRGFTGKLIRYCRQKKIDFEFFDERKKETEREQRKIDYRNMNEYRTSNKE